MHTYTFFLYNMTAMESKFSALRNYMGYCSYAFVDTNAATDTLLALDEQMIQRFIDHSPLHVQSMHKVFNWKRLSNNAVFVRALMVPKMWKSTAQLPWDWTTAAVYCDLSHSQVIDALVDEFESTNDPTKVWQALHRNASLRYGSKAWERLITSKLGGIWDWGRVEHVERLEMTKQQYVEEIGAYLSFIGDNIIYWPNHIWSQPFMMDLFEAEDDPLEPHEEWYGYKVPPLSREHLYCNPRLSMEFVLKHASNSSMTINYGVLEHLPDARADQLIALLGKLRVDYCESIRRVSEHPSFNHDVYVALERAARPYMDHGGVERALRRAREYVPMVFVHDGIDGPILRVEHNLVQTRIVHRYEVKKPEGHAEMDTSDIVFV